MIYRLHFGNNKYPQGNALYKCVADAKIMKGLFGSPTSSMVLDKANTRAAMISNMTKVVKSAGPNDQVVISYSGHGTQVKDRNGDEPDGWDEAIVSIDLKSIIDDVIYSVLTLLNPRAQGFLFSDSCFSGTNFRAAPTLSSSHLAKIRKEKIRYMPPSMVTAVRSRVTNNARQDAIPQWVVISGCTDFEFSYEGPKSGVMTAGLEKVAKKGMRVQDLYDKMTTVVDKMGYNQHPQLSCTQSSANWIVPFV